MSERSSVTGELYTRNYPSQRSQAKDDVRLFVYSLARDAPKHGHAIALVGPDPDAELQHMRDFLQWAPSRAWLVDWAKGEQAAQVRAALASVKRQWPAANVHECDIRDVLMALPTNSISVAVLDFMGLMTRDNIQPNVQAAVERLVVGGVMSLTSTRGRDWDVPKNSASDVHDAARDITDIGDRRWVGINRMVERWARLAGVTVEVVGATQYRNARIPMSVTIWKRTK